MSDQRLLPRPVLDRLETSRLGRRVFYLPETDSTNRVAASLAARGEPEGTVVLTDFQRRGKGRFDRVWHSPPLKDLLFSIILRPGRDIAGVLPLTLVFSLALRDTLAGATGINIRLKWPNDLLAGGCKLCGILAESSIRSGRTEHLIVGIGINVNARPDQFAPDIRESAASCRTLSGRRFDREELLVQVLADLESTYDRFVTSGFEPFVEAYRRHLAIKDKPVAFELDGREATGLVENVNLDGSLAVLLPSGQRRNLYGEEVSVI